MEDTGYPSRPEEVRLIPGAAGALRELRELGLPLAVVSNQSGIARGLITPQQAAAVHGRFVEILEREGVEIDAARYCRHGPRDGCACRKPAPGMILEAAGELGVDPKASYMVGNAASDMEAGKLAGCMTILLGAEPMAAADRTASAWRQVVEIVRAKEESR